jgi:hypothetical protein
MELRSFQFPQNLMKTGPMGRAPRTPTDKKADRERNPRSARFVLCLPHQAPGNQKQVAERIIEKLTDTSDQPLEMKFKKSENIFSGPAFLPLYGGMNP